jgi:hypothetical protein
MQPTAAHRPPRAAPTLEAAEDEHERDLDSLDAVVEKQIPRPAKRPQEPGAGREAGPRRLRRRQASS